MDETPLNSAPVEGPRDELKARILRLDQLVDRPSGPEMARLADLSGAKLPTSTCSDIRVGRRIPREDTLDAFVKACLRKAEELGAVVPPPLNDLEEWPRLREAASRTNSGDLARQEGSQSVGREAGGQTAASEAIPLASEESWSTGPAFQTYTRAQLLRADTVLLTDRPVTGGTGRNSDARVVEPVVPDLLPFQVDLPVTDRLTVDVAQHLRRAARDRARYSAEDLLREVRPRRLVILGDPGSGKTTLFSMITRAHAAASLVDATAKVPVLLRVRDLSPAGDESLTAELARDACRWLDLVLDHGFFNELFARGRGMLLIDGIDEAPSVSRRTELLTKISLFAGKYEQATVLISSRTVGYDPKLLDRSFEHYELAPFSARQAREVLTSVLGASAEKFAKRVVEDTHLSTLVENPLLLSIVARIVAERGTVDRLPRERHRLYDIAVEMMLADWDAHRGIATAERPSQLEAGAIRQALETVAYRMHAGLAQPGGRSVIESATLEYELIEALSENTPVHRARGQARELLRYTVIRAGLLVESRPGSFAFCHRALQEHLAACAISSRGRDAVVRHLAEHGLHAPEWRNVHLLLISMQRGARAQALIDYVLDAGSAHEEWLHRDLLLVGETLGESPALVSSIDDELAGRVAAKVLDICTGNSRENGPLISRAAGRVLRSWRDTPMIEKSSACLAATGRLFPVERYSAEALVGDTTLARDALVDLLINGDTTTADLAATAIKTLDIDLQLAEDHIDAIIQTIPRRVTELEERDGQYRLPFTGAEAVALCADQGSSRYHVLSTYLAWINDETNSAYLRGAAATGLGWVGENSAKVRECLIRMLLDRRVPSGQRSWPAYALDRLGGGEHDTIHAMLEILEGEAPILCGWAEGYLSKYATQSSMVVSRLADLAEDSSRSTLPWVLGATARLSGLTSAAIERLEAIAVSDPSIERRCGAINVLIECARNSSDWRRHAAEQLVGALTPFLNAEPTEDNINHVSTGMWALGQLQVSDSYTWGLCLRFLQHESDRMRMAATYGIGGLPTDAELGARIVAILDLPGVTGVVRGGLVDALHRMLTSDPL